jgi:hypothetical protein
VSARDRRTVGELLTDSDALARETLLDLSPDHAPAMVRSWGELVGSAAALWAVMPSAPNSPSGLDPMERLRGVGQAISRSVTAGHWPGQGPADERLTQIADNLYARGLWWIGATAPRSQPLRRCRPAARMFTARSCTCCMWLHTGRRSH